MYRIWCLRSVAHLVGDRPIYSIRKPSLVSAFWVAGRALPRVDWRSRLAWLIWSNSDGIVLEVNLEGLVVLVVVVKDDFGTVGGIAHQHVAKILVGLNVLGGSVARLGIRLAAKRRGLQGLARRVVNVLDGSLLGVSRVYNSNVLTQVADVICRVKRVTPICRVVILICKGICLNLAIDRYLTIDRWRKARHFWNLNVARLG